jgi:hypothetical protein
MRIVGMLCLNLLLIPLVFGQAAAKREYVPDSDTAVKIAEAVLMPVYGKSKIESERPFTAKLKDGVWKVSGTLHCFDRNGRETEMCVGGVAVVELSKADARIISMTHYK